MAGDAFAQIRVWFHGNYDFLVSQGRAVVVAEPLGRHVNSLSPGFTDNQVDRDKLSFQVVHWRLQ